jgi:hypothetical protein
MITQPAIEVLQMNRSSNQAGVEHLLVPGSNTNTEVAVAALTEVQELAAQRRASAEQSLAQARAFEERLADERNLIATLADAADAARAAEREAVEQLRVAREHLDGLEMMRRAELQIYADLRNAEAAAQAEVARVKECLAVAQEALESATAARNAHPIPSAEPSALEEDARADYDSATRFLDECRSARARADAEIVQMHLRIELLSGTTDLDADAVKRVVARRIADQLRKGAKEGPA